MKGTPLTEITMNEADRPETEYCATEAGRDLAVAGRTPIRGPQQVKRMVIAIKSDPEKPDSRHQNWALWRIKDLAPADPNLIF